MRLAVCAVSAVLLSGCSWLGGGDRAYYDNGGQAYYYGKPPAPQNPYGQNGYGVQSQQGGQVYGNFPQQPDFSNGYGASHYGSHAGSAGQHRVGHNAGKKLRKPRLRGSLSMGFEKSNSGSYIDYTKIPTLDPEISYNPDTYLESRVTGAIAPNGSQTTTTWSGVVESYDKPDIAFDDAHSTPFRVGAGLEYIMSPHLTLHANAGHTYAEGESGTAVAVNGAIYEETSVQNYDAMANPSGPPVVNRTTIPNAGQIARYTYNFNDLERHDAEVGARYYFDPIVKDQGHQTLTPFVGVSGGIAHYNDQSVEVTQQQAFYEVNYNALSGGIPAGTDLSYYNVTAVPTVVQLYDSQTVPTGTFTAGMEWQVTPKMAFALETGLKYEGARDYSNGAKGDANMTVPLTLRGSFNF